jgi:hypothetical protein
MGIITSRCEPVKEAELTPVVLPSPPRLHPCRIGVIRKRWRAGYMVWKIAADMGLTEWQVAKQLLADGAKLVTVTSTRNRKKK